MYSILLYSGIVNVGPDGSAQIAFDVPDFEGIAKVCEAKGVPLVVDNTFGAGGYYAQRVIDRAVESVAG